MTKMLSLSDDWVDSCGHWFDEYVEKTHSSIPELVRNFSTHRSLDDLSSVEILTVMDWLSSRQVDHVQVYSNGFPHVRPYEDKSTGFQPAGYYDIDDDFFAYAQDNGWLSLPNSWWYGDDAVVGIADNFEEVENHVNEVLSKWKDSNYKFISNHKFIVSIRQTNDLSLVHKMFHVGDWGKKLRKSNSAFEYELSYPRSKEDMKMKNSNSFRIINLMDNIQWHDKFLAKSMQLAKTKHGHHCHHHGHHDTTSDQREHMHENSTSDSLKNSRKKFGFSVPTRASYNYELACLDFENNALNDRKDILQFEILKISS